ncbi:glycoside hydrolase superfamily [Aspergillus multicolor]|uniref:glycoside hydrolase superfamily n=1 Tax=Aspergillus multicolor TaxID=41759 RepID=UPI003CCD03DA
MKAVPSLWVTLFFVFVLVRGQDCATEGCEQGCCGTGGYCGFGPDYCGDGNCVSSCNATAECGPYASPAGKECPLNVCCSGCRYCGTTSEFCDDDCQSGCDTVQVPSCSSSSGSADKMTIGYYESWAYERKCDSLGPEEIEASMWTHLNYAFALIDPNSYTIGQMNVYDSLLYPKFTALKMQNTKLKTYIAVGGWDAGGEVFSDMVATAERRQAFISSALVFCKTYAFDGIDMDWEYPAATDRGSREEDFENFVTFMQELSDAFFDAGLGVTATLPSSYWYMKGFDIVSLEPYVDWFNMMTYDIHGTWDGNNPYTSKVVNPHTNLTEIDESLNLLWRNGISSDKVVLGLGFYGRSFTLKDKSYCLGSTVLTGSR